MSASILFQLSPSTYISLAGDGLELSTDRGELLGGEGLGPAQDVVLGRLEKRDRVEQRGRRGSLELALGHEGTDSVRGELDLLGREGI